MSTFKIGDKVRRINRLDSSRKITSGEIVTINDVDYDDFSEMRLSFVEAEGSDIGCDWLATNYELVEAHKMTQNKPHKHAELIKAWADGAEIEFWDIVDETWKPILNPSWSTKSEYRLKPIQKPDIVRKMFVEACPTLDNAYNTPNLELTFDPDSGVLKSAKVL